MPHFCNCGADEFICQTCGTIKCSREDKLFRVPLEFEVGARTRNICETCFSRLREIAIENKPEGGYVAEAKRRLKLSR
jgi:C4-type Zn-finger protein